MIFKKPIRIVKFGGTSVANTERLATVAKRLSILSRDYHLVVVVSAMSGVTNQLVSYCDHMAPSVKDEEVDVVLSSGEQITSGLLALKLKHSGLKAISVMNWQLKLETTPNPTQARIEHMDAPFLLGLISEEIIPVIAGFQGINQEARITTLGRGGSDTTAVAVTAFLKNYLKNKSIECEVACDIYTDVDGIYTSDPRFVPNAKKLDSIKAPYMLELAQAGSKVLHPRSVQLALKYNVDVRVLSSFDESIDQKGTLISNVKEEKMEKSYVIGIAHQQNDYMIRLIGSKLNIQKALKDLAALYLHTDMLTLQEMDNKSTLTCVMLDRDVPLLKSHLEKSYSDLTLLVLTNKVKITLVGVGLQNDMDILNKIYQCVDDFNATIDLLSVSELKISILVDQSFTSQLLLKLHDCFISEN